MLLQLINHMERTFAQQVTNIGLNIQHQFILRSKCQYNECISIFFLIYGENFTK